MKARRKHTPVTGAERKAMRAMAQSGARVVDIMRAFDRPKGTVQGHCGGLTPPRVRDVARYLAVLDLAEHSKVSRSVLASDLGYANAGVLGVVLTRARRIRASAGQHSC